jgi:hypothetical protein
MNAYRPGSGPFPGQDPVTGGPIDDPTLADGTLHRPGDPASPAPDARPFGAPGPADEGSDVVGPESIPQLPGVLPDPQGDPLSGPDMFAAGPTPAALADTATPGSSRVGADEDEETAAR